jgi:hypothetical protein
MHVGDGDSCGKQHALQAMLLLLAGWLWANSCAQVMPSIAWLRLSEQLSTLM